MCLVLFHFMIYFKSQGHVESASIESWQASNFNRRHFGEDLDAFKIFVGCSILYESM